MITLTTKHEIHIKSDQLFPFESTVSRKGLFLTFMSTKVPGNPVRKDTRMETETIHILVDKRHKLYIFNAPRLSRKYFLPQD